MMQVKRFLTIAAIVSLIAGSAGIAAAIPTADPARPGVVYAAGSPDAASVAAFIAGAIGGEIAGEGAAPNTCIGSTAAACAGVGPGAVQHLDFLVTKASSTTYFYKYQFENTSISAADGITVQAFFYAAIGVAAGDLDATGPHALTGEVGDALLGPDAVTADPASVAAAGLGTTNASWDAIPAIVVGHETITMTLTGGPPIFVDWLANDGFTWNSTHPNPSGEAGRMVLAPGSVPEPGSLLLLGAGLVGLGTAARIFKKK